MNFFYGSDYSIVRFMQYSALTIVSLIVSLQLSFSSTTKAQEILERKVSISTTNETLRNVIKELSQQTKVGFVYSSKSNLTNTYVSVKAENSELKVVLDKILPDNITYDVIDDRIIIKNNVIEKGEANFISNSSSSDYTSIVASQMTIRGQVTNSVTGAPLSGVSVMLKGTTIGETTNAEGRYTLSVPDANGILVFSYIGFSPQEISIGSRNLIDVQLTEATLALSDVVVTALGISRDRKALAYAVTEVKGEQFTQARENNLGNALSGKIAGVNASSTATGPGGSSRVIIRGNGSLSGDNQPLYVVNGVPINNSNQGSAGTYGGRDMGDGLNSINPDDIESLSVLKGGTAAALYGSRAANGVILITTKSGASQNGLGVEFNSNYTMENVLSHHDWQYDYGSGTRGLAPTSKGEAIANGRTSWGARLDGSIVMQPDGIAKPYVAQKNNIKNFYDTGSTFSNTIALNGGNELANFRFSVSDMNNSSIVPNSGIKRNTFNLNANGNLSDKVLFEANAQYNIEKNKNRTAIADFTNNPNASVGLIATNVDVRTLSPGYDENGYEVPWNDYVYVVNPYFAINKIKNEDERRRFIGSFSARYNFTDFLYARARVGIDYFNIENYNITPTGILYNERGVMTKGRNTTYETNAEALIGLDKSFGNISVNAIFGGNQMYNTRSTGGLSSGPFNVPFNYFISNGSSQTFSDGFQESAINSLFGSADVGYNNYLYLTLTGRKDWFSTLSPKSNSLFYPSVGLSFVLSDAWQSKPSWLNYTKVRTSWAQVGGGAPDPYGLDLLYSASSITHFGQQIMSISGNTIPNALKPYTSTTTEVGIESQMFRSRLDIDLTVYDRKTTDDIVSASVARASGYTNVRLNIGEVRNKGIELLLTGRPVISSGFSGFNWNVAYNVAYNQNTVVKIADGLSSLVGATPRTQNAWIYQYEGQPYGMIAGYKIREDGNGNKVYNSVTGMPLQSEITSLGRGVPPLTMGISNNFTYKNFAFGFLLDGKFGSKMYISTNAYGTYYGLDKRTVDNNVRETGITVTGVDQLGNPFTKVVSAQEYYQSVAFSITDEFVSGANFIKLRQLTFGYSLPQNLLSRTPFQSASLSLVARNLLLLYSQVKNVDPESSYSSAGNTYGLENQGVPPTRSFGLNLAVKF